MILRLVLLFVTTTNAFAILYAPQPLLPLLAREFGVSTAAASLTISATVLALAVASLLLAPLADRWERKRVIVASSVLVTVPSVFLGLTDSFAAVVALRFLQGLFIPGIAATVMAYAAEEFPAAYKGRVFGTYVGATVAGGFLGRLIAGPIADWVSWQAVFGVLAAFSVGVALLVGAGLPPSSRHPAVRSHGGFRRHLRNSALLGACLIGFSQFFAFIGFFTYLPFYASEPPFRLSPTQISLLFATFALGVVSAPVAGFFSDRIGRRVTMAAGHLIGALGILLTLHPSVGVLAAGCALLTVGNFASQSATTAYVTDAAAEAQGAASSLYLVFYYLGGSLGAWLPGLLWDAFRWPGVVALTVGTIAAALMANAGLAGRGAKMRLSA